MKKKEGPIDPEEWAALYAAGALSPNECAQFEARLAAGDAACQAAIQALGPVIEGMFAAFSPVLPPLGMRARLLEQLGPSEKPGSVDDSRPQRDMYVQRATGARWKEMGIRGAMRRVLWIDSQRNEYSALVRCEPGVVFPDHPHPGVEQCLVLEGDVWHDGIEYGPGDYQRFPAGSRHGEQTTRRGCLLLVIGTLSATGG
jgi:quercetin dioxygenase-like cupin family protein